MPIAYYYYHSFNYDIFIISVILCDIIQGWTILIDANADTNSDT